LLPQNLLELQLDRLAQPQQTGAVLSRQQLDELIGALGQVSSSLEAGARGAWSPTLSAASVG
jgi:hypothetical protein